MATTASFKQQCPSCEAMVPIRDSNLIGRKIDCPKCKYRFVVEEPADEVEADEDGSEEAPKKKRGARDEEEEGSKKSKKGKRRGADDEEGEGGGGKKGLSSKMMAMIGVGVVAVLALGGVGYWMMSDDAPKTNTAVKAGGTGPGPMAGGGISGPAKAADEEKDKAEEKPAESPKATMIGLDALTSLIHPEAEGVCTIRFKDLLSSDAGRAMFESPGSFRSDSLRKRLGLDVNDLEVLIQAWNFSKNWTYTILHTSKPIRTDLLATALHAKKVADKDRIEDQDYYVLDPNAWRDLVGRMATALLLQTAPDKIPARSGPLALRVFDDQTLVFAEVKALQDFLRVKGRFQARAPEPKADEGDAANGPATQGGRGRLGGGGKQPPSMPMPSAGGGGGGMQFGGQGQPPRLPGANPAAPGAEEPGEGTPSGNYLTVQPDLKRMLDRLERKHPVLALALDMREGAKKVDPLSLRTLTLEAFTNNVGFLGASLNLRNGIIFNLVANYIREDEAVRHQEALKTATKDIVAELSKHLNTNVEEIEDEEAQRVPGQPGQGRGAPGGGLRGGRGGPGGFPGMMPGMQMPGMQMPGRGGAGGRGPGLLPPALPGNNAIPGIGGGGLAGGTAQEKPKDTKPPGATVKLSFPELEPAMALLTVDVIDPTANSNFMNEKVRHLFLQQKGYLDIKDGKNRIQELAQAARKYPDVHQDPRTQQPQFPRGTAERIVPASRAGRPYLPDERVSWMADLLPFLSNELGSLSAEINRQKSWRDPENAVHAATLVPYFLDPQNGPESVWVKFPKVQLPVAATHYVGIAGIGLDAPEYSDTDTSVANKLGIFGYDRATRIADIKDGSANTIMIAEVPLTYKRAWMAGGGSTVVGVPEKNSVAPFVCTQREGKRGTNVIMADGSVRFISESVSDEVFKALCTYAGGERVNLMKDAPPVGETSDEPKEVKAQ
jgi:hypothetical protein